MKITNKIIESNCQFDDLRYGDVCIYRGGIYMKIESFISYNCIKKNAINLDTSRMDNIPENADVVKIDAELIIKQKEN